ncbi:MAG TPA: histidine phosphatase family protein [Propionibacteriaceae bacterium]|jgi:phosphohistidine phosphatase|nr:histidine phosphatase family protein [Propionibacteriaceae bacterium]
MSSDGGRTLIAVRHAKSSWDHDVEDHDRPLSGRGRRDADALGRLLVQRALRPDLVLCSTAARTRETWERAHAVGATAGEVRLVRGIYHAWVPELVRLLRQTPDDVATVLLLGHSPGIPDLVEHVCIRTDSADWVQLDQKYPTSGVAVVNVPVSWRELGSSTADLVTFAIPRG